VHAAPFVACVGEHAAFSRGEFFRDDAHKGLIAVHKKVFDRLQDDELELPPGGGHMHVDGLFDRRGDQASRERRCFHHEL
jgi:hypothetical protein